MQTSIDRSHRRPHQRRKADLHPNIADLARHTAWLAWPLIHWGGHANPAAPAETNVVPSLHDQIAAYLRPFPAGLYALQPVGPEDDEVRLLAVTVQRLAGAAHALALARQAEKCAVREWPGELASQQGQSQKRLHLLGQALRELTAERGSTVKDQVLRRISWHLEGGKVGPPLELSGVHHRAAEFMEPGFGQAIMEFALRTDPSQVPAFIEALRVLLAECHLTDQEPERRRRIFCSLLKETMNVQPAYLPVAFHSLRRGRILKWQPNPDFAPAAVGTFFREYLPAVVAQEFSDESRARTRFEVVSEWFLGVPRPAFQRGPLVESQDPPEIIPLLTSVGESSSRDPARPVMVRLLTLAARCAAITGDAEVPRHFASWLGLCRQCSPLMNTEGGAWGRALVSLETWIVISRLDADNLRQFFAVLAARGMELLRFGWIHHPAPPVGLWALGGWGALRPDQVIALVDLKLINRAHQSFLWKPKQLAALLDFIAAQQRHWLTLSDWQISHWVRLFSEIRETALLQRLIQWMSRLLQEQSFTFHDVTSFIRDLAAFLGFSGRPPERVLREAFLAGNFAMLDRILEEADTLLRALPEGGFEDWRSHAGLWTRRFPVFEIFYHWEQARFSDGRKVAEAMLAGCRETDRRAIERKQGYLPSHFCNVSGNEALVVRLTGGSGRRLLDLLNYYVEPWNRPDNPYDGWLFLDRYPAIQRAIQRLIGQCASYFQGVTRMLRRLALAVRLQRRAFLADRLEAWMEALVLPEPIESLRAFGVLAGYSDPLPSAVERVAAREERLRQEHDTLAGMAAVRTITPSAQRRLTKLVRLLADPAGIAAWAERDAHRLVAKHLPLTQLNSLSAITRQAVRQHWREVVDSESASKGKDWDNALHFYYSTEKNKEVLRKLLRHTAKSDLTWRRQHPPNAKFLADLQAGGFDAEAWLAPYRTTAEVHGETWTLHLEQNPLRILQMGNLFGTCLSVDDFNAFSAIANAAEINKQVLYLQDGDGTVIGRKLIGLTTDGRLFGFKSYGAACLDDLERAEKPHVWIKIFFDLACVALARRAGVQFDRSPDPENAADRLRLTAEWYNDGPEEFDWWTVRPDLAPSLMTGDRGPVARSIVPQIQQAGFDERDPGDRETAILRALLWIGDEAAPIVHELGRPFFGLKCARFLRLQSTSAEVRALLTDEPRK